MLRFRGNRGRRGRPRQYDGRVGRQNHRKHPAGERRERQGRCRGTADEPGRRRAGSSDRGATPTGRCGRRRRLGTQEGPVAGRWEGH